MKGLLGKGKGKAVKFEFQITIHNLGPWPAGNKQIAIGWQRGSKKKGVTSATMPSQNNNYQEYIFEDTSTISVTLYKDGGAQGSAMHGPFHKKVIIFAILETDAQGAVQSSQGSLVLNLADYAKGIENSVSKGFNVAVGKAITAAVGEPKLSITIRSRYKKQQRGPGSVSGSEYSADTTGRLENKKERQSRVLVSSIGRCKAPATIQQFCCIKCS